jgi:hypothetical protein
MLSSIIFTAHIFGAAQATLVDLIVTNRCNDTIWPAINTQAGAGPSESGFELATGKTQNLTVNSNWNGRVWGRTNCTFDDRGYGKCLTGDCGGILNCTGIVSRFSPNCMNRSCTHGHVIDRAPRQHSLSSICLVVCVSHTTTSLSSTGTICPWPSRLFLTAIIHLSHYRIQPILRAWAAHKASHHHLSIRTAEANRS